MAAALLAIVVGCGGDNGATPKLGTWVITELTGEITMVDLGCHVGTWTFPADLQSTWNGVKVSFGGDFAYYLGFKGVAGSPHPDSYNSGGSGLARGGSISGQVVREDLGSESSVTGSYDEASMHAQWTMKQHVQSGECIVDVNGSGTFTAIPY